MSYPKNEFTKVLDKDDEDGFGEDVWSCNNCGAYASSIENIKHHTTCKQGEAKHWEDFYEKLHEEVEGGNMEELIRLILEWWEIHQYDTYSMDDGEEDNLYDEPPPFVKLALKLKGGN